MPSKRWNPGVRAQTIAGLFAIACYLAAIKNGFAWDDTFIVYANDHIHSWAGIPGALRLGYWYNTGHLYRPLTTLSFALDWIAAGGEAPMFHAVNIAWHALATVLVARLALRWWSAPAAGMAACIFAVQPAHVEVVANIVGRSELLCGVALLALALVATRSPGAPAGEISRYQLFWIAVLAAVAAASKETGVVAPAVAWAALWLTTARDPQSTRIAARRATIRGTAAACAGVGFELVVRFFVLGGLGSDRPHPAFRMSGIWQGTALALASVPRALSLILVPQPPRPDYSPAEIAITHPNAGLVIAGILLVGCALAAVIVHVRRPTPRTFAVLFAAVTFAPVSNLLVRSGIVIAERTLYSPSAGVALLEGAALAALGRARPRLAVGALLAILAVSAVDTLRAIPIWSDTASVFAAMRERAPASYRGYALSATESDIAGDHATARRYYAQAFGLFSKDPEMLRDASANALLMGDTATALTYLGKAMSADRGDTLARSALAGLLAQRGDTAGARHLRSDGRNEPPEFRAARSK